jgi:predicted ester cyclase
MDNILGSNCMNSPDLREKMSLIEKFFAVLSDDKQASIREVAERFLHPEVRWHVAHPVNDLRGIEQVVHDFLVPLMNALPDLERKAYISVPGEDGGSHWLDGTGYFVGTFTRPLFGIPPTGKTLYLRYTDMVEIKDGKIKACYIIPDFLDAMKQAGVYPLRPSLGYTGAMAPPAKMDGLCREDDDPDYSASSRQLVMNMLDCLRRYDGKSLESMDLENYWHPDFMWYGPGGIGTTRGIKGFRKHHQGPFLKAFPDRDVDHHVNTVACGEYVATGGWPHMHGTHSGGDWLGLPPTGCYLSLRVMDIWRREGKLLRENWVAIDIPHMLQQMGLDVFAQMKSIVNAGVSSD